MLEEQVQQGLCAAHQGLEEQVTLPRREPAIDERPRLGDE
jgi:hypothetical protein